MTESILSGQDAMTLHALLVGWTLITIIFALLFAPRAENSRGRMAGQPSDRATHRRGGRFNSMGGRND